MAAPDDADGGASIVAVGGTTVAPPEVPKDVLLADELGNPVPVAKGPAVPVVPLWAMSLLIIFACSFKALWYSEATTVGYAVGNEVVRRAFRELTPSDQLFVYNWRPIGGIVVL